MSERLLRILRDAEGVAREVPGRDVVGPRLVHVGD